MEETAFKEMEPILCLALSAISLAPHARRTYIIPLPIWTIALQKIMIHFIVKLTRLWKTSHPHFKAEMDRRPDAREHGRFKRQRTSVTDAKIDPHIAGMSDESDDGGVKLDGYYGKPAVVKQEPGDREAKRHRSDSPQHESEAVLKRLKPNLKQYEITPGKHETLFDVEAASEKRQKKEEDLEAKSNPYLAHQYAEPEKKSVDPKSNPYLAHMYEEDESYSGYSNGYGKTMSRTSKVSEAYTLARLPRHKTTAAMAKEAENGPNNPFTGVPLSSQYFNILKTRRNLPVHVQRYVHFDS